VTSFLVVTESVAQVFFLDESGYLFWTFPLRLSVTFGTVVWLAFFTLRFCLLAVIHLILDVSVCRFLAAFFATVWTTSLTSDKTVLLPDSCLRESWRDAVNLSFIVGNGLVLIAVTWFWNAAVVYVPQRAPCHSVFKKNISGIKSITIVICQLFLLTWKKT